MVDIDLDIIPAKEGPDCVACKGNGTIDVVTVVTERNYGMNEEFAKVENFTCFECRGYGRLRPVR